MKAWLQCRDMQALRLSKSSGFDAAKWEPGYRVRWRYADDRFAVGDWCCSGAGSGAPSDEVTRHFEINLHRRGWHVRSFARRRFFIDPLHHSVWPADCGFGLSHNVAQPQAATLLFVTQEVVEEVLASLAGSSAAMLRKLQTQPAHWRSSELTARHARMLATDCDDRLAMEEHSLALIRRVVAEATQSCGLDHRGASTRRAAAIDQARSYILSRYREPLSLSSIAASCRTAPSTLCESFPRVVGMPVWKYVQRLRLQEAALALAEGAEDLSSLALDLGFSSHSHFAQAFRAHFGATPSQFRRAAGQASA
jgi:AraC family transcriptional regulator